MKVRAILDKFKHAHLYGLLDCKEFEDPKRIHFVIDTGCTTTTILGSDTERLEIQWRRLRYSNPTETATATVRPRKLQNPDVIFQTQNNNGELIPRAFTFEKIDVMPSPQENLIVKILNWLEGMITGLITPTSNPSDHLSHSLLGMDFLQQFKHWEYADAELILDTD